MRPQRPRLGTSQVRRGAFSTSDIFKWPCVITPVVPRTAALGLFIITSLFTTRVQASTDSTGFVVLRLGRKQHHRTLPDQDIE